MQRGNQTRSEDLIILPPLQTTKGLDIKAIHNLQQYFYDLCAKMPMQPYSYRAHKANVKGVNC